MGVRITAEEAVARIDAGELVALPTDTVYGLAAQLDVVFKLFELKRRPLETPCLILAGDVGQILPYVLEVPPGFEEFGPGPVSWVLPVDENRIPAAVRAGLPTAGFRVPDHVLCREVLRATGPLAVSSANLHGGAPAISADEVEALFGSGFPVLDGGPCAVGHPSRILAYRDGGWVVLRD